MSASAQRRCAQCARELRGCLIPDGLWCETCEDRHDAERAEAHDDEADAYESCPGYAED